MDRGGRVAACPWFVYVWEQWAGAFLSPSPSSLLHPGKQRSSNTPITYMTAPPTSHLYSDRMWANAHSSSRGLSSCSCMVPYLKPFLYSLCSSNGVWETWCYAFEPSQGGLDVYAANRTRYVVGNCFALLCVGTGGLASAVATRGVDSELHSDTGCYVTGIHRSPPPTPKIHLLSEMPAKQISWSLCMGLQGRLFIS